MDFYMYLPSNTGDFTDNTISRFRVKLPNKIDLEGEWEVALVEIAYPITWFNIGAAEEALLSVKLNDERENTVAQTIPFNNYTSVDALCDSINYTLDQMHNSTGIRINIGFTYDTIRHRVVIRPRVPGTEPNVSTITLSPHLQYMLGFRTQQLNISHSTMEILFGAQSEPETVVIPAKSIVWLPESNTDDIKTLDSLNSIMSDLVDSKGQHPNSRLGYAPETGVLVLHTAEEESNVRYLKFSEKLRNRLGLTDEIIYPKKKYHLNKMLAPMFSKELISASDAPDISGGQYSLFVYCDVVRPQIVGNVLTPILRAVSIKGKYGEIIDELYDNPHYVPVLKKEFVLIEINISDDRGKLVKFQYGKLFVKLHFRPKA